jgi:TetR/AcrR family transcriptional regulator, cholesterol catabolism regulator
MCRPSLRSRSVGTGAGQDRAAVASWSPHRGPRRSSDRREEILRVATALFADRGYGATGMRDIADAAGVLAGSLYGHFASKTEILLEATTRFHERLAPRLCWAAGLDAPGAVRVRACLRETVAHATSHPAELVILEREWPTIRVDPGFDDVVAHAARAADLTASAFRAGVVDGSLRPELDPDLAHRLLASAIHGIVAADERHLHPTPSNAPCADDVVTLLEATVLGGMLPHRRRLPALVPSPWRR